MKKLYLILIVLLIVLVGNAQERDYNYVAPQSSLSDNSITNLDFVQTNGAKAFFISEGFEVSVPPSGWTIANPTGGTGWNRQTIGTSPMPGWQGGTITGPAGGGNAVAYCSWNSGGATSNNQWLITPQLNITSGDFLSFYAINYTSTFKDKLEILVSTTTNATTSFTSVLRTINWPGGSGATDSWTEYTNDLSAYAGQSIYIAFREVVADNSADGGAIGLDLVSIGSPEALDAGITNINLPQFFSTGTKNISGFVHNFGTNPLVSFDVVYTINETDVSEVYSVNNINIPFNQSYTFTHNVPYNFATAGVYNIKVEILNVNGDVDLDLTNNVLDIDVSVASGIAPRRVLHEVLTSSTCGPCAQVNPIIDNVVLKPENRVKATLIKYQVSWPGNGDPYQTPMAASRVLYYGTEGVPDFWVDGNQNLGSAYSQTKLNNYAAVPSYFKVEGEHTIAGKQIEVDVTITPYVNFTGVCHVVVVEKETTGNVGTNGETRFYNVAMAMLPNAGTTVNVTAGTPFTFHVSKNMTNTFVEDMGDLEVVLFLQIPSTKEVVQSNYSVLTSSDVSVGSIETENLKLFPNPAKDKLFVQFETSSVLNIVVMDYTGKVVTKKEIVSGDYIDVSNLASGMYFVDIKNSDKLGNTYKFIVE